MGFSRFLRFKIDKKTATSGKKPLVAGEFINRLKTIA